MTRLPTDKPPPPEKKLFLSQFRRRMVFIWLITLAWFSTWIWLCMSEISIGWKIVIGVALVFSAPDASQSDSPLPLRRARTGLSALSGVDRNRFGVDSERRISHHDSVDRSAAQGTG